MYELKSKSKGTFKKTHLFKCTGTNIIFKHNPPRFKRNGSSFSQVFKFRQKIKYFGRVFNHFYTAPMISSTDEILFPLRASFIGSNVWKPSQCRPL
jgi:hypothetical protein